MVPMPSYASEVSNASKDENLLTQTEDVNVERQIPFNEDWKFILGDPIDAEKPAANDADWRSLDLPHDWSIEFDFTDKVSSEIGHLDGGTGWYRKSFTLPESMKGKRVDVNFGGVYMDSTVYVNGKLIGNYPNGYTPFSYDLTDVLIYDGKTENVIAVKAINKIIHNDISATTSRWYSGSGIYRDVNLTVTDPIHVAKYGTQITTPNIETEINSGNITVSVQTKVENESEAGGTIKVRSSILNYKDGSVFVKPVTSQAVTFEKGETKAISQNLTAVNPNLWTTSEGEAALYTMRTEILVDDAVVDSYDSRFGFRYFNFDADEGFSLNGNWMKLNGVCMHHDQGALGAAANYRAIERQMQIMKDMGVNAIRVTHNPADDKLLEICDRLGLLVIEEAFDSWGTNRGKKAYDYGRFFSKAATHPDSKEGQTWAEFDIKAMVERGKNFPSIIMWSIGNEINSDISTNTALGTATAKNLTKWVKEIDTTRKVTLGEDGLRGNMSEISDNLTGTQRAKTFAEIDVVGLNYSENRYDAFHQSYPEMIFYGSEISSAVKSRGYYSDPQKATGASTLPGYQLSSYDNYCVGWGRTASDSLIRDRNRKFSGGQFIWTGFDYIGEPTPWNQSFEAPPKSSYFGIVDTAGFPKDDFYLYQSQWTKKPMVHIMPHWNWEDETMREKVTIDGKIPVRIYSNAKSVELYFKASNDSSAGLGVSQGKQTFAAVSPYKNNGEDVVYQVNPEDSTKLYLEWKMAYVPGTITAVAYDKDNNEIAREAISTASKASQVKLSMDRQIIKADGTDLSYITVDILDENGNFVPNADNLVNFKISGDAKIVGVDNGNAASWERYKDYNGTWKRKAFSGKALVIVQSSKDAGTFTLTANSAGLKGASATGFTVASGVEENIVVGYETPAINIICGETPILPTKVVAVKMNGQKEEVGVTWGTLPDITKVGKYTVNGTTMDGGTVQVVINVAAAKAYSGLKGYSTITEVGVIPDLPENVSLIYNTGETVEVPVVWDAITLDDVKEVRTFKVAGTVTGTAIGAIAAEPAVATIRVSNTLLERNIAINGKASASQLSDNINAIVDGKQIRTDSENDRWTNWRNQVVQNQEDWVAVELDKIYDIGKINLNFFVDGACSTPSNVMVEYFDVTANSWKPVSDQDKVTGFTASAALNQNPGDNYITFTPVETNKIRAVMTQDGGKRLGLMEFQIFSNVLEAPDNNAQLGSISLDGLPLDGFSPDVLDYIVTVPYGTEAPKVTSVVSPLSKNSSYYIIQALDSDSMAAIVVTAEDGKTEKKYSIQFVCDAPNLKTVTIQADKDTIEENERIPLSITTALEDGNSLKPRDYKVEFVSAATDSEKKGLVMVDKDLNIEAHTAGTVSLTAKVMYRNSTVESKPITLTIKPTEKSIVVTSYEKLEVTTKKGIRPELPETILSNVEGSFSRQLAVTWDTIPKDKYRKYGSFSVQGNVKGQVLKPTVTVFVKDFVAVQQVSSATPYGVIPDLPAQLTVYASDGTVILNQPVEWEDLTADMFNVEEGNIVSIEGNVVMNGIVLPTTASIRVTKNEVSASDNYIKLRNGYELPYAIAYNTNDSSGSSDRVTKLNDGSISFLQDGTKNVWTDWTKGGSSENWIGGIIAVEGVPVNKFVDTVKIGFFDEKTPAGCIFPDRYSVEYYVGPNDYELLEGSDSNNPRGHFKKVPNHPFNNPDNWKEVSYTDGTVPEIVSGDMTAVTFTPVNTSVMRIKMKPQAGASLGVTEIQFFGKAAVLKTDFTDLQITVDGKKLQDSSIDKTEYSAHSQDDKVPKILAAADNNASVTIVPAEDINGTTKIIVVPEDGSVINTKTYNIRFYDGYSVAILPIKGAVVTTNPSEYAEENQMVSIHISELEAGYDFESVKVLTETESVIKTDIVKAGETYEFKMPKQPVTVKVTMRKHDYAGGSPAAPNPDGSTTETVTVPAAIDKDGNANVSITNTLVKEAIKRAEKAAKNSDTKVSVIIEAKTDGAAKSLSIDLPKEVQKTLIDKNAAGITIKSKVVEIGFDNKALHTIYETASEDAVVKAVPAAAGTLSKTAQKAVGNRPVYDISVTCGSRAISNFGKGSVYVGIPYTLGKSEITGNVIAAYIDEAGKVQYITNSSYNAKLSMLMFEVNHLSRYAAAYKTATPTFTDVSNHSAKDSIYFVASRGILNGNSKKKFNPNASMTRGMFITALGRIADADISSYKKSSFADIKADAYYMGYVEWAIENKIITGVDTILDGSNKFVPNKAITREEMAAIVVNYAEVMEIELLLADKETKFADDASISEFAKESVAKLTASGILSGKKGNIFNPNGKLTRGTGSTVIKRLIEFSIQRK